MTADLQSVVTPVPRDRWQRPLVVPEGGGKPVAYTRCTRFVGVLEDTYNLGLWQQRMVALGLSQRPDLMLGVTAARDDKGALDRLCADAAEAAKAHEKATIGTALHALAEQADRGRDLGVVPDAYVADLAAYADATAALQATAIEQFCVQDWLRVGGTPDRVVRLGRKRYIADIKTGSIEYGIGKIAMQLAVYARSRPYDPATGARSDHGAELDRGIIIHLPAGTGTCTLWWVDLLAGWEAVKVARAVWAARKARFKDLTAPFESPGELRPGMTPEAAAESPCNEPQPLSEIIEECATEIALRSLWAEHAKEWTDALTMQARARIQTIREGKSK